MCKAPGIRLLKERNICIIQRTQKDSIRCYPFPLQKACVLTYNGSQAAVGGMFVVALTLEDFPAGTTNFGSVTPFSSIPLQFLAMVISNHTGHCDEKACLYSIHPKRWRMFRCPHCLCIWSSDRSTGCRLLKIVCKLNNLPLIIFFFPYFSTKETQIPIF